MRELKKKRTRVAEAYPGQHDVVYGFLVAGDPARYPCQGKNSSARRRRPQTLPTRGLVGMSLEKGRHPLRFSGFPVRPHRHTKSATSD